MSPMSACEHTAEVSECGCAVRARACEKDVRSVARERTGRKREREKAREKEAKLGERRENEERATRGRKAE